jgi:hypothetical protein
MHSGPRSQTLDVDRNLRHAGARGEIQARGRRHSRTLAVKRAATARGTRHAARGTRQIMSPPRRAAVSLALRASRESRRRSENVAGRSWQSAPRESKGVRRTGARGIHGARCCHRRPDAAVGRGFSHALSRANPP